jgi:hypothetical protein
MNNDITGIVLLQLGFSKAITAMTKLARRIEKRIRNKAPTINQPDLSFSAGDNKIVKPRIRRKPIHDPQDSMRLIIPSL